MSNHISVDDLASALLQPISPPQQPNQPVKIRKKPGRKPNPASPALRKAQNRAAQRAFRERKERHLREMEVTVKQIREQRDRLQAENDQLKNDSGILASENWYLKGIVLTLQLVCFRHNLVIPQHNPYINEEALGLLAQSIPQPIAAYVNANVNNKIPFSAISTTSTNTSTSIHFFDTPEPRRQRDRFLSSGSIVVTKDGIQQIPKQQALNQLDILNDSNSNSSNNTSTSIITDESRSRSRSNSNDSSRNDGCEDGSHDVPELVPSSYPALPSVSRPTASSCHIDDTISSNLAAIQILRLRLRLQSMCQKTEAQHFAIQPTVLQLTIPHDPRIDLIPTPHMRDRMILFRDLFDLDDCLRCLLGNATFHGGDPAVASNWQLPAEFFDKFWFLTTDFSHNRISNEWCKAQGLSEQDPTEHLSDMPELTDFFFAPPPLPQQQGEEEEEEEKITPVQAPASLPDTEVSMSSGTSDIFFSSPIELTYGYMHQADETEKDMMPMDMCPPPWDREFVTPVEYDYDTLMESLIDTDHD